ncbi:MAG: hypothetical protein COW08_07905 [Ignavibacteriales bacterium CG12_big_fil_rev_8_21_14_0_65_30_8]|nr:MAG: hypothetical protein COW08_07905 [Ignavibacteriales bacterium CG12_big_fil_rev_8_21_14_0_65_30_8]
MFSNYLKTIEGIGIYPLFSLLIFFIFFLIMIIWVIKVDKKYIDKMSNLPLDLQSSDNFTSNKIINENYIEDRNEIN